MLKRTLLFSNPYHLSATNGQIIAADKSTNQSRSLPPEDLGFVVFEHPLITLTQGVMQLMAAHNVAVVFCDEKYLPVSMVLNLDANHIQSARFRAQLDSSEPLRKNLWMQTVKQKILNQAEVLKQLGRDHVHLRHRAKNVRSGDPDNQEAGAAAHYWKELFGPGFRRERFGHAPNAALNYGYAILRAAVARAIAGSGLHPTLGIHHRNKYNAFCLADDLMEPYRPFVDRLVLDWISENPMPEELTSALKMHLLGVLSMDVMMEKERSPLMVALSETSASLAAAYEGSARALKLPTLA